MVRVVRSGVLAIAALACASVGRAEVIERVLAVVGGQLITLTDVTAARELGLEQAGNASDPIRAVLTKLIDRELVIDEVDRYAPPEPPAPEIDRELAVVRARFPTPAAFEAALARSGIDEQHVREILRQNLRIRAYEDRRFTRDDPRRQTLIDDWIAGLRRRGDIIDVYLTGK